MTILRGWSDRDIMECDLRRLCFAIEAKAKADGSDWRQRARLAGITVEEPIEEPETDADFNDQLRLSLRAVSKPSR